jgi:3D (Asp-Asp-Asp) domain-containing protein
LKNILIGAGVLAIGLFNITVHENQVQIIKQQDAHISSLETKLESKEQTLTELNKTLEKTSGELTEALEQVGDLEKRLEDKQKELDSLISLEATAYTPFCSTGCVGITAGGTNVADSPYKDGKRVVAVDPSVIPLGTEMTVHTSSGSFDAIADDTGGDIQGHRIDVLVMSKTKAKQFGRQSVTVELH